MSKSDLGLGLSVCTSLAVAGLLLSTLAAAGQPPSASDDPGSKFPPGEGRNLVMQVCSKCHALDIIADQNRDGEGWQELVNEMENNGAQGTDAEFDQIVAYLTKAFPAK